MCKVLTGSGQPGTVIREVWGMLLTTANSLLILILVAIAFMEILRINANTYGIKKLIPTLLLAVIAANFSFLISRILVDASSVAMTFFTNTSAVDNSLGLEMPQFNFDGGFDAFLNSITILAIGIGALVLAFLFLFRNWVVYVLIMVSPLAFLAMILPQTKSLFNQWWSYMLRWTFMPVISIAILWLGFQLGNISDNSFMMRILTLATIIMAIMAPFKVGGSLMNQFGNLTVKKAGKWAGSKVKSKWIDPMVEDKKTTIGNWFKSFGSKSPNALANPIGAWVRRARRVQAARDWHKKESEGWDDQLYREAFGGKTGGIRYMSDKDQAKWGQYMDNVNSLYGEKDWKDKNLKRKYYELGGAEGKEAYLRTRQYEMRVEADDTYLNNFKNKAKGMAALGDPAFHDNKQFRAVWEDLLQAVRMAQPYERLGGKSDSDNRREVKANAYKLNEVVESFRKHSDTIEKVEAMLADPDVTDPVVRKKLEDQRVIAEKELKIAELSYAAQLDSLKSDSRYFDKNNNKFIGLGRISLQGIVPMDENGNVISEDISKAGSLTDGEPEAIKGLLRDRTMKELSAINKEEYGSTTEKRISEESARLATGEMRDWFMKMVTNRAGDLNGKEYWKIFSEIKNSLQGVSSQTSTWSNIHDMFTSAELEAASDTEDAAGAVVVRDKLAQKHERGLETVMNGGQFIAIKKDAMSSYGEVDAGFKALTDAEKSAKIDEFLADETDASGFQVHLREAAVRKAADLTKVQKSELESAATFVWDSTKNTLKVDLRKAAGENVTSAEYTQGLDVLGKMNQAVINADIRGPGGQYRQGFDAEAKLQYAPVSREGGKELDNASGLDATETIEINGKKVKIGDKIDDLVSFLGVDEFRRKYPGVEIPARFLK